MSVFVDTSALIALFARDDRFHLQAREIWRELLSNRRPLVTSNYVLLECSALLQNRYGLEALRDLHESITPLLSVHWADETLHNLGMAILLTAGRRRLSLVDCISFAICRQLAITSAFAFDPHFAEQGIQPLADR